jgi:hypothetical protein
MMMSEDIKLNPIWVRYCSNRMEDWLSWARKVHIRSYVELTERFMDLHPHYIPSGTESNLVILDKMLMDRDFIESLTDTGIKVWADSNLIDFVRALDIYSSRYPEIKVIVNLFKRRIQWLDRVYRFARAEIIADLRNNDRQI